MSLRAGPLLTRAVVILGSITIAAGALAQARVPQGADSGASRVLEIDRVLGGASIQRDGRTVAMQPGFLLFSGERMTILPRARVDLRLLRYGDIAAMASGDRPATLTFEKLPFSSWAVDLATNIRLESGVLRVRWARSGDVDEWPMAVLVDRWRTQLSNGEFLFRRDASGMVTCSVAGKVDMVDDDAKVREHLKPGRCLKFNRNGTTDRTELAIADWPELGVVLLRDDIASPAPPDRSLAMKSRSEASEPVVPAPPPAPVRHTPPPIPPQVPLSVAEESVRAPRTEAQPESPPIAAPPKREAVAMIPPPPADAIPTSPPPISQRPLENEVPPPPAANAAPPESGAAPGAAPQQASAGAAAAVTNPDGTSGSGPEWIVNVMTVNDIEEARQHVATLTSAGYPATLRKEVVRGRASYRVIISGISNEQGARRTAQLLSTKMGYTTAWPLQKR